MTNLSLQSHLHDASWLAQGKCQGCAQTFHANRIMEVGIRFKFQPAELAIIFMKRVRFPLWNCTRASQLATCKHGLNAVHLTHQNFAKELSSVSRSRNLKIKQILLDH
jgi:hypothetical protein